MIDLEWQLAGKLVDTKVMGALEHKGFMPPQHLTVIDATLSMPGATLEAEYQRRINAINAYSVYIIVQNPHSRLPNTGLRRLVPPQYVQHPSVLY